MRSSGQTKFNEWLLEIGNGIIENIINQRNTNIKHVKLDFGKHSTNLIKDVFLVNIFDNCLKMNLEKELF